jgi:peptide deformylase
MEKMSEVTLNIDVQPGTINNGDIKKPFDEVITIDTESQAKEVAKKQVKIFELVPDSHPILKQKLKDFDFANPPVDPNQFASTLVETCIANHGLGLSANQCGFDFRVFVMGQGDNYVAFFNPTIVAASQETVHLVEGCLSFPMLALRITRPAGVVVEYQDFNGERHVQNFTGISARCVLHELDHMDGIVYTERVKSLALQQGLKKRDKMLNLLNKSQKKLNKALNGNTN